MRQRIKTLKIKTHKRDNFTCQKCKIQDKTGTKLEAHHIIPLYIGGKDKLNNLITLCFDCHHYAPDKKKEFDKYMKEELDGTLTTFLKAWEKAFKEQHELVKRVNEENIKE